VRACNRRGQTARQTVRMSRGSYGAACAAVPLVAIVALAGCGGGSRELAGYSVEPVPSVGDIVLPDLTDDGADFALRADAGKILLVYFGYTNCPDFCPNTMSNVKLARQRLDDPADLEMAMVTVDPARDLDTLASYVTGFIPDAHALGTTDDDELARATSAFGASYDVSTDAGGEPEVAHTTLLYAVDDTGHVVLAWPFGVSIDDLAADIDQLLDRQPEGGD
jgi:protein SCO1